MEDQRRLRSWNKSKMKSKIKSKKRLPRQSAKE